MVHALTITLLHALVDGLRLSVRWSLTRVSVPNCEVSKRITMGWPAQDTAVRACWRWLFQVGMGWNQLLMEWLLCSSCSKYTHLELWDSTGVHMQYIAVYTLIAYTYNAICTVIMIWLVVLVEWTHTTVFSDLLRFSLQASSGTFLWELNTMYDSMVKGLLMWWTGSIQSLSPTPVPLRGPSLLSMMSGSGVTTDPASMLAIAMVEASERSSVRTVSLRAQPSVMLWRICSALTLSSPSTAVIADVRWLLSRLDYSWQQFSVDTHTNYFTSVASLSL